MKAKLIAVLFAMIALTSIVQGQSQDLYRAARTNDVKLAQTLIDQKVDINQKDERGYTALILATYNQSPDVAELLLKYGADTESGDATGRTALMGASLQGDDQCVAILLDHGAKIHGADVNGAVALMYAVQFGRKSVVKLLIARNADPYIKDKRGFDAFYLAQQLDDPEILGIVQLLRKIEGVETPLDLDVGICVPRDQQLDHRFAPKLHGIHQRNRSVYVRAVDLCAVVEKDGDALVVTLERRTHQSRTTGRVSTLHICAMFQQ